MENEIIETTTNQMFLGEVSKEFIIALDNVASVFDVINPDVILKDGFSKILLSVYQGLMIEHFKSSQLLIFNKQFFSFGVLCRSLMDIIIQIAWVDTLDIGRRDRAINEFSNFEGINFEGKIVNEWYKQIDEKFTLRKEAIRLGLDSEFIKIYISSNSNDVENDKYISLTIFDYLSKLTHWNPMLLKRFFGLDKNNHLTSMDEHIRLAVLSTTSFFGCIVFFARTFVKHFYENKHNRELDELDKIRLDFDKFIMGQFTKYFS